MMKNAKPVYVIGHRNPDTDSICSAIAYAALKQKEGENAIAARAGQINSETQYALDYFKAEVPTLIVDLYPRVRDIMLDCTAVVKETDNLRYLGRVLQENNLRSIPVMNDDGRMVGIVTVSDLAQRYFEELNMQDLGESSVSLKAVVDIIEGEVVVEGDESAVVFARIEAFDLENRVVDSDEPFVLGSLERRRHQILLCRRFSFYEPAFDFPVLERP